MGANSSTVFDADKVWSRVKPTTTINDTIPGNDAMWKNPVAPLDKDIVTGTKDQRDGFATYRPECSHCNSGGCDAFECSAFTKWEPCEKNTGQMTDATGTLYTPTGRDYTESYTNCYCSTKPVCSRPNIKECWLGPGSGGDEPTFRANWSEKYADASTTKDPRRKLECSYDITKIDTVDQISKYISLFKPDPNDEEYGRIMRQFCSVQSKQCLLDPQTNTRIKSCSRVTANTSDPSSSFCRYWFEGLNDQSRDALINNICANPSNERNPECRCYNRLNDPKYINIVDLLDDAGTKVQDSCFYLPCKKNTPAYLVDSKNLNPYCPQNICQNIIDAQKAAGNVNIASNQLVLNCKFSSNENIPHEQLPDLPDIKAPFPSLIDSADNQKRIIGTIIICVLFAMVLLLVLLSSRNKNK